VKNVVVTEEDRSRDLSDAIGAMRNPAGLGITVEPEDSILLQDAFVCYRAGADAGAVFCAHAASERDLAAFVAHSRTPPKQHRRWGLGQLITHCRAVELVPLEILNSLEVSNEHRRTLYHYGHSGSDSSILKRTVSQAEEAGTGAVLDAYQATFGRSCSGMKELLEFALAQEMRATALGAIRAALNLRSWLFENPRPRDTD
jgi:hypothetical protein